jgi:hypothetical protein
MQLLLGSKLQDGDAKTLMRWNTKQAKLEVETVIQEEKRVMLRMKSLLIARLSSRQDSGGERKPAALSSQLTHLHINRT